MKKFIGLIFIITLVSFTYFYVIDDGRIFNAPVEIPPNYSETVAAKSYELWQGREEKFNLEKKLILNHNDRVSLKYLSYDKFDNECDEYLSEVNSILDMILPYANFTLSYSLNYYQLLGAKYCNSIENTITFNNYHEFINVQSKVKQIAREIEASTQSESEKVRKLNEYLIKNVQYDTSFGKNLQEGDMRIWESWGALNDGQAVCSGYVNAFSLICKEMEIPVVSVVGYRDRQNPNNPDEVGHEWNEVFLDGLWTAVDVTSNDPIIEGGYMSDADKFNKYGEKYLFVTQEFLTTNKFEWNQENLEIAKKIAYPNLY